MTDLLMNRRRKVRIAATAVLAAACLAGAARAEEVSFSVMQSGTYDKAAAEIAASFKEETGIDVKISAFPWAVLRQNNTTDLISGTGQYDVMSGGYYLADVYGYFAPLTDYIAKDDYADGMISGLMEPGRSEYMDGQQIGIPYGIDAYGLIYNTKILADAGVTPEFATWADVIAACDKIEATGVACFSHPSGSPEQIGAFFFSGYDGTFVNADGAYEMETDKAVAAAADVAALWKHLPEKGTALTFDEAGQLFKDGEVAMLVTWPSFVTRSLDAEGSGVKGSWSMAKFPGDGFPWLSLWQLFVPTTAADKDAAWAWIKAFAGPEHATRNLVEYNIGSVWQATYEDAAIKEANAHFLPALLEGFASAKNPPLSGEAQDMLTNTLQDIANGRQSAEDGIAAVNAKWATIPVPAPLAEAAAGSGLTAE